MESHIMEKIAEASPELLQFIASTRDEVNESPFRDEILEDFQSIIKTAQGLGSQAWGAAKKPLGMFGAAVGLSVASSLAGDIYDSLKRGLTKGRNYKSMMTSNPDLHEHPAARVQSVFNTLHRFNPDFSSDPNVAGSYVRQQLTLAGEHGQVDLQGIHNLISSRKNLAQTRALPISSFHRHPDIEDPMRREEHEYRKSQRPQEERLREAQIENIWDQINQRV